MKHCNFKDLLKNKNIFKNYTMSPLEISSGLQLLAMLHFKWSDQWIWYFPLASGWSFSDSDLTSSSRRRKVTLLPMLAVSLSSRAVRTKPRGGRFGHCCFLAEYISFTPFVQLFATTLRYLEHTQKLALKCVFLLK